MAKSKVILRYEIQHNNGNKVVHWDGVFQPGDMSLCGSDLMGDGWDGKEGWQAGEITNKKVNCLQCLKIIEHVKNISNGTTK